MGGGGSGARFEFEVGGKGLARGRNLQGQAVDGLAVDFCMSQLQGPAAGGKQRRAPQLGPARQRALERIGEVGKLQQRVERQAFDGGFEVNGVGGRIGPAAKVDVPAEGDLS
jgi:hypothetical protein